MLSWPVGLVTKLVLFSKNKSYAGVANSSVGNALAGLTGNQGAPSSTVGAHSHFTDPALGNLMSLGTRHVV